MENTTASSVLCLVLQFCEAMKQDCNYSKSILLKFVTDTCLLKSWESSTTLYIDNIVDIYDFYNQGLELKTFLCRA